MGLSISLRPLFPSLLSSADCCSRCYLCTGHRWHPTIVIDNIKINTLFTHDASQSCGYDQVQGWRHPQRNSTGKLTIKRGETIAIIRLVTDGRSSQIISHMLDLKNQCLHPATSKPYIISSKGGRENSIEGLQVCLLRGASIVYRRKLWFLVYQNGLTHIFIHEFNNTEDRDYYVRTDPAHLLFSQRAKSLIDKVQVVDFAAGAWWFTGHRSLWRGLDGYNTRNIMISNLLYFSTLHLIYT